MKRVEVNEGERYGRLTIVREVEPAVSIHKRVRRFLCKCDCGNEVVCRLSNLKSGCTKSCGCYKRYMASHRRDCHHLKNTRIYRIWCGMKRRCYNKHNEHFDRYGGRGIVVCDEWKSDFMNFYDWAMSNGYEDGLSIDRINNDGNYEPSNCRFATQKQQVLNSTGSIKCTIDGTDASLTDVAEILGVSFRRIRRIVYLFEKGYSVNELLSLAKKDDSFLFADVPDTKTLEDLPKKCEFKPKDWCLMRGGNEHINSDWTLCQFSHLMKCGMYRAIGGCAYNECIPYNDQTAHLLGTNDDYAKGGD